MEPPQAPSPFARSPDDPYRATRVVAPPPPPPTPHAPGRALAVVYAIAVTIELAIRIIARVSDRGFASPSVRSSIQASGYLAIAVALAWLYSAWKGIPESHRGTVSPKRAAFSLFIPFYNAYWAIAVNVALCDTLDGILQRAGSHRRAPRVLGIVASAVWLGTRVMGAAIRGRHVEDAAHRLGVDLVLAVVVGGLWLAYMIRCDRAREAVARLAEEVNTLGPPRLSPLQRTPGPSALSVVFLILLVLIPGRACWQRIESAPRPAGETGSGQQ